MLVLHLLCCLCFCPLQRLNDKLQCWYCTSLVPTYPVYKAIVLHLPVVFVFPPTSVYFITALSLSLPGSVRSPPSGDRPPTKEWVLVGVVDSRQLRSVHRMREKMVNMQQSAIREVAAGRQALQEAQPQQALDQRVRDAEERVRDLQTQLEASQNACQVLHQSLLTSEQSLQTTHQSLQTSQHPSKGHKLINKVYSKPCKNHKPKKESYKKGSQLLNKVHKR